MLMPAGLETAEIQTPFTMNAILRDANATLSDLVNAN
jgi:hypothetical protein